ncbi:MAG: NFACT family protein [Trueperaceae bacterium]|nr:NFACT family protein [Trueperaceae bacterium]
MEGLLIAEVLEDIALPAERLSWRFPDEYTFILPLGKKAIWLFNRPPNSRIAFEDGFPGTTPSHSGFQDLLLSKATGRLEHIEQIKLDRVVKLHFAAGQGFVPTPEVTLVAELTGRNCNLILLDKRGTILGAARDISAEQNRFRQIRAGLSYLEPPPYDKLDPRTVEFIDLKKALEGKRLKQLRSTVDGIGPDLSRALAISAGMSFDRILDDNAMESLFGAMKRLVREPSRMMREALELPDVETLRKREERQAKLERLRFHLDKEAKLLEKRLEDADKAMEQLDEADHLRLEADLLMAYQSQVPKAAKHANLQDFEGKPIMVSLDPKLSASANAQERYQRIKKRQVRAEQALTRLDELSEALKTIKALQAKLETVSEDELGNLYARYVPTEKVQSRLEPGIRYTGPHGYTVIVGRNAKENDIVSFRLARSKDVWLHVQGYTGSHVIIQAGNKEVPFETILFAAQLAAAYSKAGQSENVPVDYTLKKNVWKPKGAAPGAVHFTQQKTVYVNPSRRPEVSQG